LQAHWRVSAYKMKKRNTTGLRQKSAFPAGKCIKRQRAERDVSGHKTGVSPTIIAPPKKEEKGASATFW